MGKAARGKREQREAGPLPARFDFGPQFLVQSTAREPVMTDLFGIHDFNEKRERPCPQCGGAVVYQYGNWRCGYGEQVSRQYRRLRGDSHPGCGWSSARHLRGGDKTTLEKCPDCGGKIVYNGNYFCENLGGEPLDCHWALPHPPRTQADRELALRLTGRAS